MHYDLWDNGELVRGIRERDDEIEDLRRKLVEAFDDAVATGHAAFEREQALKQRAEKLRAALLFRKDEIRVCCVCDRSWSVTALVEDHFPGCIASPEGCMTDKRYSQQTKDAHGAVILAGMSGTKQEFVLALRQLATMVHCDLTGELREPHTLVPLEGGKQ